MKIVQTLVVKLLCLLVLVGGAVLILMWFDKTKYAEIVELVQTRVWEPWGLIVAISALVLGFFGFLPIAREKKSRNIISYPGTHGSVTIQLDSVESTLSRVLSKLPEVRKISVKVSPTEDNHRARVSADVLVYKGANTVSAREVTNRIGHYLHDAATNILGVEEVTDVNLNIRGILVDAAKPNILRETSSRESAVQERDNLLREEPAQVATSTVAAAAPMAAAPIAAAATPAAAASMPYVDHESTQETYQEPEPQDPGAAALRSSFAMPHHDLSTESSGRVIGAGDTSFGALVDEDEEEEKPDLLRYDK